MKDFKIAIIFLLLLSTLNIDAQKENKNKYFVGSGKGLDSLPDKLQWDPLIKNTKHLNLLLREPLNLKEFKKAKQGRSNSGGGPSDRYLYKPNYNGFYYFYFVFEGYGEHGPRVVTFKKGKEMGGYMDSTEVFIQLSCDAIDKDLGKANILAMSSKEILQKFGGNYLKKGRTIIYQYDKTILIISYSPGRTWFKIARLSKAVKGYDEIERMEKINSYF